MKPHETTAQCVERKLGRKLRLIRVARGEEPADIVFKNATYLNVFSNDFCHGDIAVSDGLIAGIGSYHGMMETAPPLPKLSPSDARRFATIGTLFNR